MSHDIKTLWVARHLHKTLTWGTSHLSLRLRLKARKSKSVMVFSFVLLTIGLGWVCNSLQDKEICRSSLEGLLEKVILILSKRRKRKAQEEISPPSSIWCSYTDFPTLWKESIPMKLFVNQNGIKWRCNYLRTHLSGTDAQNKLR